MKNRSIYLIQMSKEICEKSKPTVYRKQKITEQNTYPISLLVANGTTSARGVERGVGRGDVLQTGHVGWDRNQGSTHLR